MKKPSTNPFAVAQRKRLKADAKFRRARIDACIRCQARARLEKGLEISKHAQQLLDQWKERTKEQAKAKLDANKKKSAAKPKAKLASKQSKAPKVKTTAHKVDMQVHVSPEVLAKAAGEKAVKANA